MRRNRKDFLENKERALALAKEHLSYFNQTYQFDLAGIQIKIKNQKTRWGSYSKKGTINFNYRIVRLPQHLLYCVIVHELCHLGEFNHSKNFWNLVAKTLPNYAEMRRELRKNRISFY